MASIANPAAQPAAQVPGQQPAQPAGSQGSISASVQYQVTPCIVLGAGPVVAAEFEKIRQSVEFWLGDSFPKAAVRWSCIDSIIGASSDDLQNWAEDLIQPLLSLELWRYLLNGEYIDRLPSVGQPAPIRVYVFYDPEDGPFDVYLLETLSHYLNLATMYRRAPTSAQRAKLDLVLILPWLGHKRSPISASELHIIDSLFQSVYIIDQVGESGLAFTDPHMRYEVIRIFIHALVASETASMASQWQVSQTSTGSQTKFLGIGTSAITSALAHMRDYRTARILQVVISPFIGALSNEDALQYREAGEQAAAQVNIGWGEPTIRALMRNNWVKTDASDSEKYEQLYPEHQIAHALRTCSDDLIDTLTAHLIQVNQTIKNVFEQERQDRIGRLLDQGDQLAAGDDIYANNTGQTNQDTTQAQQEVRLARVLSWFSGILKSTGTQELLPGAPRIKAIYAADEAGWHQHAISEATREISRYRVFLRLQKATGTPVQLSLRVLPAWPLLSLLLQHFFSYPAWQIWLGALMLLLLIGIPSFLLWKGRLDKIDKALYLERVNRVRRLVLGIATHYALIENDIIQTTIRDTSSEVMELLSALESQAKQSEQNIRYINDLVKQKSTNPQLIEYFLYDLPICDEWVKIIIDREVLEKEGPLRPEGSAATTRAKTSVGQFVSAIIRATLRGQLLGRIASQGLANISIDLGKRELDIRQLTAIGLCNREPNTVNTGNRWSWLHISAHPMARADQNSKELTIVALGERSDLMGGFGRSSTEWEADWLEARSRQPHRLTCVRIITLPGDYLTQI